MQFLTPNWSQPGPTKLCPAGHWGTRMTHRNVARRPTTADSFALAVRWLQPMPHNSGSGEQMFGAE